MNTTPVPPRRTHNPMAHESALPSSNAAPWNEACTFDAGGDLALILETNPDLPGIVIAALKNTHKGFTYAIRTLKAPANCLPSGPRGPLSSVDDNIEDLNLRNGLRSLLDDCTALLAGPVPEHSLPPLDVTGLTARIPAGSLQCRRLTVHDAAGQEIGGAYLNLPHGWTSERYEGPLSDLHPEALKAARSALRTTLTRLRRTEANHRAYRDAFGSAPLTLSSRLDLPDLIAEWNHNWDDCGPELMLRTADPARSWQVLRLLGEWLGNHEERTINVTMDDWTREVTATLRGTRPLHLLAWDRAR
ncbi:hypothetical protein ACFRR6_01735 [Streptomyces sp. NPDC056891]|uniref:hypothetical protein n=1 Tax=Streptomyces sp. NPDC056891 TaxID=3345961 RepID=UPI0036CC8798